MNELKWIPEEEQQKELKKRIDEWKTGYSKDGYVLSAEGTFTYRGIAYLIRVLRYYNHTDKFCAMGKRISDKHVVVEWPDQTKEIVEFAHSVNEYSEFLYHDTLHTYNDNQTVEEQIQYAHKLAKEDIDGLLSDEYTAILDNKIKRLTELKQQLKELQRGKQ